MNEKPTKTCEAIITIGIASLVVFTPIFFGSRQVWAYSVMELVVVFLLLVWAIKLLIVPGEVPKVLPGTPFKIKNPLTILLCVFIGWLFLQLTPLPEQMIEIISPKANEYSQSVQAAEIDKINEEEVTEPLGTSSGLRPISLNPIATRTELLKYLSYIGVILLIGNNIKHRWQLRTLFMVIIAMGFVETVFALFGFFVKQAPLSWLYVEGDAPYAILNTSDSTLLMIERYTNRAKGTFTNPDHFCAYMEMVIPLALGFWGYMIWRSEEVDITLWKDPTFLLFSYGLLVMSLAILLSLSRAGIASFLISLALYLAYFALKKPRKKWRIIAAIALPILCIIFWTLVNALTLPMERLAQTGLSAESRLIGWSDTLRMIPDFPVLGSGLGTFVDVYMLYESQEDELIFDHAHNDYLEFIAEAGIPAFLLLIAIFTLFLRRVLTLWLKSETSFSSWITFGAFLGVLSCLFHSIFDFCMHIPANAFLFSTLLGILWAGTNLSRRQPNAMGSHPSYRKRL